MKRSLLLATVLMATVTATAFATDEEKNKSKQQKKTEIGIKISESIRELMKDLAFTLSDEEPSEAVVKPSTAAGDEDTTKARKQHDHSSSYTVEDGETVDGDIVVRGGDLTVYGTVNGDAMVVGGTIYVKKSGRITGNATVVGGDIVRDEGGVIEGYTDITSSRSPVTYRKSLREFGRTNSYRFPWFMEEYNTEDVVVKFNRVEGIFLGAGREKRYFWSGDRSLDAYGFGGYAFAPHLWRGMLGLSKQIQIPSFYKSFSQILDVSVEGYSLTDTKDQWLIGVHENSAGAFFFREDNRDYYERRGITGSVGLLANSDDLVATLRVAYAADTYKSLAKRTSYAMFAPDKDYRINPPVAEGTMRSFQATVGFSTNRKTSSGMTGWTVTGTTEFADKSWGSDFGFNHYLLDMRLYQPLSAHQNVNFRVRAGSSEGVSPDTLSAKWLPQRSFEIGGVSTLPAYSFKTFSGNRLLLANMEVVFVEDFLEDFDFWVFDLIDWATWIVFADAGWVSTAPTTASWTSGFETVQFNQFRHDLGVAIGNRSGTFRIGYVRKTDMQDDGTVFIRITRPF